MTFLRPVTDDEPPAIGELREAMKVGIVADVVDVSIDGVVTFEWFDLAGARRSVQVHEEHADKLFAETLRLQ